MTDSLHPGNGGNPGFGGYDLDSSMKMVFYPAIIGWTLFGCWMADLRIRFTILKNQQYLSQPHGTGRNG
jgi:heme exporter protein C